jgi:magnesium transporter
MLRLFKIDNGLLKDMDIDVDAVHSQFREAVWIDVQDPGAEEKKWLQTLTHEELPKSEELEEIEASARSFVDQDGIHIHSLFLVQSEGRHSTASVACILQNQRLITIREGEPADFRLLRMRAKRGQVPCESPAAMLITLLDQKVENHADTLEDIHRQLENVSHFVLEDDEAELEDAISQLAKLEDSNGKIRLCLMDTQRDISFLLRSLRNQPQQTEMLRDIMRDIDTLMSHATFLFDKINFLMDSTQGFINIEQNQIIKIFSIAAVVLLPPTLVASIYGMNFNVMPELKWLLGYPWALCLMVLSGLAPYWYFKRKGWL